MKTYNVAVVGAGGWIGGVHSDCWIRATSLLPSDLGACLHTAVDLDPGALSAAGARYGFKKTTTKFEDAVNDPEVDIIDICCSNQFHKDVAVAAAKAGKAIICEKPISITMEDAREMVAAAKKYDIFNRSCFMYREYPSLLFIKELVENGTLGKVMHIRIQFEQDFYCDPDEPYTWRFNMETSGGGSIVTLGAHVVDLARFFAGDFDSVIANFQTAIPERPTVRGGKEMAKVTVDDEAAALVKFKNGATGIIHTNWLNHGRKHHVEMELCGSKATILFNSERLNEICIYEASGDKKIRGFKNVLVGAEHPNGELFNQKTGMGIGVKEAFSMVSVNFVKDIASGVKGKIPTFEDGLINLAYIKKIQESHEKNAWVSIGDIL